MLLGDGGSLFLGPRLNDPLGYVNGQAGYLLLGLWPLIALAERAERHWLAGLGVAGATLLVGLAVLAQTRAVVPAVVLSAVILLATVPGRGRRVWALVAVVAGVGGGARPAPRGLRLDAGGRRAGRRNGRDGSRRVASGRGRGRRGVGRSPPQHGRAARARCGLRRGARWRLAPVAVAVLAAVVVARSCSDPVDRIDREYQNFVELRSTGDRDSRFTSGAGNRYDYWRVAADQFADDPIRGVGAGNYDRTYFLERRTSEDVRQAHSIELQVLGELGLPGIAALALFLIAVLAGFARRARAARHSLEERGLAVAAGGAFLVWLLHTSVDWLHLIPGITGLALAFAAVLVGPWRRPAAERATTRSEGRGARVDRCHRAGSRACRPCGDGREVPLGCSRCIGCVPGQRYLQGE